MQRLSRPTGVVFLPGYVAIIVRESGLQSGIAGQRQVSLRPQPQKTETQGARRVNRPLERWPDSLRERCPSDRRPSLETVMFHLERLVASCGT